MAVKRHRMDPTEWNTGSDMWQLVMGWCLGLCCNFNTFIINTDFSDVTLNWNSKLMVLTAGSTGQLWFLTVHLGGHYRCLKKWQKCRLWTERQIDLLLSQTLRGRATADADRTFYHPVTQEREWREQTNTNYCVSRGAWGIHVWVLFEIMCFTHRQNKWRCVQREDPSISAEFLISDLETEN